MLAFQLGGYLGLFLGFVVLPLWIYYTVRATFDTLFAPVVAWKKDKKDKKPKSLPGPRTNSRPKEVCSVEEAVILLNVSQTTIKKYIREGRLRTFEHGGEVFLHKGDVEKLPKTTKKSSKAQYPVVETYSEHYKITNPVEFTT